jgi:lipopolysaccharide/colanic/teichoic acid biosynthesis glycosyltransferase
MKRLDLRYVRDASLWLDLWILFKTVPAVLSSAFED